MFCRMKRALSEVTLGIQNDINNGKNSARVLSALNYALALQLSDGLVHPYQPGIEYSKYAKIAGNTNSQTNSPLFRLLIM